MKGNFATGEDRRRQRAPVGHRQRGKTVLVIDHSQIKLAREALTICGECGVPGPTRLLDDHKRLDHGIDA